MTTTKERAYERNGRRFPPRAARGRVGRETHLRLSRATASTASSGPSSARGRDRSSSRPATRRWPRSWPARTPSSPARSASAWRPPARARSTCSTASTTPSSTTSRSSRSSASRRASALGGNYQQEVDLLTLFKDVAARVRADGDEPAQVRHLIDRAMRIAHRRAHGHLRDRPQRRAGDGRRRRAAARARHAFTPASATTPPRVVPPTDATCGAPPTCSTPARRSRCWSAPGALRRDRRGDRGRRHARRRRRQGAARQGRACPTTCRSSPARSACSARKPSWDMMQDCDTLLMVGSSFPYSEFLPEGGPGARRADRHRRPACSSMRYPMEVNLVGDSARDAARAAAAAASARTTAPGARRSRRTSRDWWKVLDERAR